MISKIDLINGVVVYVLWYETCDITVEKVKVVEAEMTVDGYIFPFFRYSLESGRYFYGDFKSPDVYVSKDRGEVERELYRCLTDGDCNDGY